MALASLFAVSSDVGGINIGPTRNVAYAKALDRSIRQSLAPSPSPSPNIVGRVSCLPATNDRCGLRGDRLCAALTDYL